MRDVDARLGEVRVERGGPQRQEAVEDGEAELEAGHAVGPLRLKGGGGGLVSFWLTVPSSRGGVFD